MIKLNIQWLIQFWNSQYHNIVAITKGVKFRHFLWMVAEPWDVTKLWNPEIYLKLSAACKPAAFVFSDVESAQA